MAIERINIENRDEWLAWRHNDLTASDMAIVCGVADYGSQAELFAEKKKLRPPRMDSGVMKRGRWGEASVFEALADIRPEWQVQRAKLYVRDTERRIACTPDGFAIAPDRDGIGIVQAKTVSRIIFRDQWLDDPTDGDILYGDAMPPASYRLQTLTEMMLNDCKWGVLAVLITAEFPWEFRLFEVLRDPIMEDQIYYHADRFWREYLDPGIMPPFEPLRDEALVKALYPKDNGSELDLTGDNRALALVEDLGQHKAALARNEEQIAAIKTELTAKLGEHSFGRLADGRRLSWRKQHRKAYTVPPKDFRVFRVLDAPKGTSS